ncbi:enoyl-CoA hydratase/isomerase family protein [Pseudonocardia sp. CA-142604]|uniref:enoyl-CoA hydratase/isomerase family protein n=1 Tax=Pseudonocardia sp. CA-142604 TaxID=3240024 RepID=UPI003D8C35BB
MSRPTNCCGRRGRTFASEMLLTGEPVDAQRALSANLVSKVVPHGQLLDVAEAMMATILRNDQTALESAKETIFDVIGRPLDEQLAVETWYGYALMGNEWIPDRLRSFYDKSDKGRAGKNATSL